MKAATLAAALVLTAVTACGNGTTASVTADRTTEPSSTSTSTSTPTPTCSSRSGFELSLVSDRGGQRSPVLASEWFATHDQTVATVPRIGWHEDGTDTTGTFTRSGQVRLHVIEGPDKTWQVDSGTTSCTG